jgi:hypothetical protein
VIHASLVAFECIYLLFSHMFVDKFFPTCQVVITVSIAALAKYTMGTRKAGIILLLLVVGLWELHNEETTRVARVWSESVAFFHMPSHVVPRQLGLIFLLLTLVMGATF